MQQAMQQQSLSECPLTLTMGTTAVTMGSRYLGTLRESNDALHDRKQLQHRLQQDGYLLLRGLQLKEHVLAARRVMLENLAANGQLDSQASLDEARAAPGKHGAFMGGRKAVSHHPEFLSLVESPEIFRFFTNLLDTEIRTYDFKWLRAVAPGRNTAAHYDVVYMGRGTVEKLYTVWTPLGDVGYRDGPLAILEGSHILPQFQKIRDTYGRMDVDRDNVGGWFSEDPLELIDRYGGQWKTTAFEAGDVLIFGMLTMHASFNNVTDRFRLSCDTRFQPASEPIDERWVGTNPLGHYRWNKTTPVPMAEARKTWGV